MNKNEWVSDAHCTNILQFIIPIDIASRTGNIWDTKRKQWNKVFLTAIPYYVKIQGKYLLIIEFTSFSLFWFNCSNSLWF